MAAHHLLSKGKNLSADEIYALCRLTWLTAPSNIANKSYIQSVKLPALCEIFNSGRPVQSLEDLAAIAANKTGSADVRELIVRSTGFTNLYNAYRNSALDWIMKNRSPLNNLLHKGYHLNSDREGLALAKQIAALPPIQKAGVTKSPMHAESLVTPVIFALDPRLRFPVINQNRGIEAYLKSVGAAKDTGDRYLKLMELYQREDIRDAVDIDEAAETNIQSGRIPARAGQRIAQRKEATGKDLSVKDEDDVAVVSKSLSLKMKRIHNRMTNQLIDILKSKKLTLLEGTHPSAKYDALLSNFNGQNVDLLIEVKSSNLAPDIRMGIGQLLNYQYNLKSTIKTKLALLLPRAPALEAQLFLEHIGIGLLWMGENELNTSTRWLDAIAVIA